MIKDKSLKYKIRVKGVLNRDWENIFPGFKISTEKDHDNGMVSTLVGEIIDQAQLYGIFSKMRDMGCVLLDVNQLKSENKNG